MPLPDFIIAGERRCGTTSLAGRLASHPNIFVHPKQDANWFVDRSVRAPGLNRGNWDEEHALNSYLNRFPTQQPDHLIAEKSADYLFWRPAHQRIANTLPNAKFVVTLRHPVERAWSHYWNEVAKGRETLAFSDAIASEDVRCSKDDYSHFTRSYRARGEYATSLKDFLRHIPETQVLITTVEGLRAEPKAELARICGFLGTDNTFTFPEQHARRNVNWAVYPKPWARTGPVNLVARGYQRVATSAVKLAVRDRAARRQALVKAQSPFFLPARDAKMPQDVRQELSRHFASHMPRLEEIAGRRFSEWDLG